MSGGADGADGAVAHIYGRNTIALMELAVRI
jgi:hypothetical protein